MPVIVRPFEARDHTAVLACWQAGFAELATAITREARAPVHLAIAVAAAAGAAVTGHPLLAVVATAWIAAVWSPLGARAAKAMLWRGILAQTREDMSPSAALVAKWCQAPMSAFLVAELDGRVVGCAAVYGRHALYKDAARAVRAAVASGASRDASVWRVAVDAGVRRAGVGRALMAAAEAWAARHGYDRVSLITGNPESKRFYATLGYVPDTLPRCVAAVFGTPDPGRVAWLDAPRLWMLRSRLARGNILVKRVA